MNLDGLLAVAGLQPVSTDEGAGGADAGEQGARMDLPDPARPRPHPQARLLSP